MSFSQALSGLNAASQNLDVIGNNIANSQTYGFKGSSAQFSDVYAGSKVGQGVQVAGVLQNFGNGTLETTGRNLDLGINGNGFLRFQQSDQVVYSRNGQLTLTPDGYLENASGAKLTGFPAGVGSGGQPEPLQVPSDAMTASPTTSVTASFNLDASAATINRTATPFDSTDPSTYSYANTSSAYDSLGVQHTLTTYFTKTGDNTWEVQVGMDGTIDSADTGKLVFNSNGTLDKTSSTFPDCTFTPAGGAASMNFTVGFDGTTQFGSDFALSSLVQNGYTSGSLVGISFDTNGDIVGSYSNEQSRVLGTIALANFTNPEGLQPAGDNAWTETGSSGQPLLGVAGTGQLGSLQDGVLEDSNVDLATQLVNLIIAQRDYQANTQTIKTQSQVLQTVVNLS